MQQLGYDAALSAEATDVLMHVDRILPGQQRFAQLMEQLARLAPVVGEEPAGDGRRAVGAAAS